MTRYWLTPIPNRNPFALGGERILCVSEIQLQEFQQLLKQVDLRPLIPFKAHLLAVEDESGSCGTERMPFDLSLPGDIVFDGVSLRLSKCGQTMLDRHPGFRTSDEALLALERLFAGGEPLTETARWIGSLLSWIKRGWSVILLKEEL